MTRQMTDDEVLAVLDCAAETLDREADGSAGLREARAAVAALQAERDALRGKLAGETARAAALEALAEQSAAKHNEACEWAERDRAALEALRGQVAGLVREWRSYEPSIYDADGDTKIDVRLGCADELDALLAIKERMG